MQWFGRRESSNVDDRRGMSGGRMAAGGGIGGIIIAIVVMLMGGDPEQVLQQVGPARPGAAQVQTQASNEAAAFVKVVLADNEDVWHKLFKESGETYREPTLVLFSGSTESACGFASAASGPFYCPGDEKVYIDLTFYDDLARRFGAPGDFAMAYVVAHEVGHHIQKLFGVTDKVHDMRSRLSETEYNKLSVKLELQADFYAGVWAHHAQAMKNVLEPGDIEEALSAANAIGDDRLQKQSQGHVVPDAFTHGTSEQRMYWFKKGFDTGDIKQGDTFRERL